MKQRSFTRALPWGVEPHDVARAGWAVVFHEEETAAVRKAMKPLIEHRRRLVGADTRVKELVYQTGESASAWLARHDVSWHNVVPDKVPYYLLWVGSPARLPFEVTHEIDSDYCVGLLDFQTPDEYARYAKSVVDYETAGGVTTAKEVVFFGTRHPFDDATALSADWLVGPLTEGTGVRSSRGARNSDSANARSSARPRPGRRSFRSSKACSAGRQCSSPPRTAWCGQAAIRTSSRRRVRCSARTFPGSDPCCPHISWPVPTSPTTRACTGSSTFHFACYGGGTPRDDLYAFELDQEVPVIAPEPFVAALPRRLLAHPNGGALACIAHVERAWGSSITGVASSPQIRAFQRALATLLVGKPAGVAVQEFNDLSATLSEILARLLGDVARKKAVDDGELVSTWTARNDAGGFVLIGDPAVRLRVNDLL